jgi:hypothetical protein
VPQPYFVLGNANLTNAFGAFASIAAMAATTTLTLGQGQIFQVVALTAVVAIALLSHVSIFGLLLATLLATAVFYRVFGGRPLRRPARLVFVASMIAAVVAVASYYAHFGDAYRSLERTGDGLARTAPAPTPGGDPSGGAVSFTVPASKPYYARTLTALGQGVIDFGWPILALALVGAWRVWVDRRRDRLTLAVCGWAAAYLAFLGVSVLTPVDVGYERYAAEFMGRVDLSTYPAAVLLAAYGCTWLWRAGFAARLLSIALVIGAFAFGAKYWTAWVG